MKLSFNTKRVLNGPVCVFTYASEYSVRRIAPGNKLRYSYLSYLKECSTCHLWLCNNGVFSTNTSLYRVTFVVICNHYNFLMFMFTAVSSVFVYPIV